MTPAEPNSLLTTQDLAAMLKSEVIQTSIQTSMTGMENRLAGKIDSLESAVTENKEKIENLAKATSRNTIDLATLESRLTQTELRLEERFEDLYDPIPAHPLQSTQPPRLRGIVISRSPRWRAIGNVGVPSGSGRLLAWTS